MSAASSLHRLLRDQTAQAHRRLERRTGLGTAPVSSEDYRLFIRVIHAFLDRVEPALETFPHAWHLFSPPLRKRAHDDLVHLGAVPAPAIHSIRVPTDDDEAWGYSYVLEGARLGGRMMSRGFRETHPTRPTAYLWSPSDEGRWRDFRARLARADLPEEPVVNAARAAFTDLEQCYDVLQRSDRFR